MFGHDPPMYLRSTTATPVLAKPGSIQQLSIPYRLRESQEQILPDPSSLASGPKKHVPCYSGELSVRIDLKVRLLAPTLLAAICNADFRNRDRLILGGHLACARGANGTCGLIP